MASHVSIYSLMCAQPHKTLMEIIKEHCYLKL